MFPEMYTHGVTWIRLTLLFCFSFPCTFAGVYYNRANLNLTDLQSEVFPPDVTNLVYEWNLLTKVPANVFRNLSNLQVINLQLNSINFTEDFAFADVGWTLTALNLKANNLRMLTRFMFSGMT